MLITFYSTNPNFTPLQLECDDKYYIEIGKPPCRRMFIRPTLNKYIRGSLYKKYKNYTNIEVISSIIGYWCIYTIDHVGRYTHWDDVIPVMHDNILCCCIDNAYINIGYITNERTFVIKRISAIEFLEDVRLLNCPKQNKEI